VCDVRAACRGDGFRLSIVIPHAPPMPVVTLPVPEQFAHALPPILPLP